MALDGEMNHIQQLLVKSDYGYDPDDDLWPHSDIVILLLIDIKEMMINLVHSTIKIVIMKLHLSDVSYLERAKKNANKVGLKEIPP